MITKDEAYQILFDTIKNESRHPDYSRVTELADEYYMYATGNGVEDVLEQFNPREEEDMFEQRKKLTIPLTPAVIASIKRPFFKVPRTQPVTRKIALKKDNDNIDNNDAAVVEIEDRISKFYGGENNIGGLDYFLQNRFVDLSFIDPNAWVVIEFDEFNPLKEKAIPRPWEVSSYQAINFELKNNVVQWLIVEQDITYQVKEGEGVVEKPGKKYTIYGDNDAWTFTQTSEDDLTRINNVPGERIEEIENRGTFAVEHYETLTKRVPAFRVGYIADIETDGRTFVSPYHDALCFFKKSIKQGSEYDLSTTLHTFPQKILRLTKKCPGDGKQKCSGGRLMDGSVCSTCNGTGIPIHTSGQDYVAVEMPDNKEEYIPLTDFVHYVELPIELLRLQKEWLDSLKIDCHQTVFNSTALLRSAGPSSGGTDNIEVTATETDKDMESVYDTLAPFAEKVSSVWVSVVQLISIITDNDDKVLIIHRFPSKFKLKTRNDLYAERKMLQDSGIPTFVISAVDDELAEDIYADDPDGLLKYRVKRDHFPFMGKTEEQIQMLLQSTTVLRKTKVLYNYYDDIFKELEQEDPKFYFRKYAERKEALEKKADEIIQLLDQEQKTAFNMKLGALPPESGKADGIEDDDTDETDKEDDNPDANAA